MPNGYNGKILRVDLERESIDVEEPNEILYSRYLGGGTLALYYLLKELKPRTDPLAPENILIFSGSVISGTPAPGLSRFSVAAKSPLTSAFGEAEAGGWWIPELKFAGFDAILIKGRAKRPVYLWIHEGETEIRDASPIWGKFSKETQEEIRRELKDDRIRIALIGPAGERTVRSACILNELKHVNGRTGLGAVMGSKNLKAIAIRGSGEVAIADKEKYKTARDEFAKAMKDSPVLYPQFSKLGTPMVVDHACAIGIFPTKNFSATGEYAPADKIGVEMQLSRNVGSEHCYGCPVGCSQVKVAKTGAYEGIMAEGPEYETFFSFGGETGVDNIDAIIAADRLADELGLDTISAGVTIGFAMELYEKGILTDKDTGGLRLNFGNDEAMLTLLRLMAYREGIGGLLADGSKAAAVKIGKGSEKYAIHVKGLELPAYDVRGAKGHGLNFATSYTGADHNRGYAFQEIFGIPVPYAVDRFSAEGKGKLTKWNQDVRSVACDAATMCAFLLDMAVPAIATQNTANLMEAVTGLKLSSEEVQTVGERINNLARAFNAREGFTRKDDTLPERLMTEPLKAGASKGHFISKEDLKKMLDEYYTERGWDVITGTPTRGKLTDLGLGYAADALRL